LLAASPPLRAEDVHGFRRQLDRNDWFERLTELHLATTRGNLRHSTHRLGGALARAFAALTAPTKHRHRMTSS
jgi:hypothetical protein